MIEQDPKGFNKIIIPLSRGFSTKNKSIVVIIFKPLLAVVNFFRSNKDEHASPVHFLSGFVKGLLSGVLFRGDFHQTK